MRNVWPTGAAAIRPGRRRPARIRSAQVPACALVDPPKPSWRSHCPPSAVHAPALIGGIEAIEPSRSWSRNLRAAGNVRRSPAGCAPPVGPDHRVGVDDSRTRFTSTRCTPQRTPLCFAGTRRSRGRKCSRWVSIWVERNATDRPHDVRGYSPGGTPLSSSGTPAGSVPGPFLMRAPPVRDADSGSPMPRRCRRRSTQVQAADSRPCQPTPTGRTSGVFGATPARS